VGQCIKQGRLAGVRIPHESHRRHFRTHPVSPIHRAARIDVFEPCIELPDPPPQQASIRFQLGLARTPKPDAAFLPLEMRPATDQSRRQVAKLRQLDLQLALEAARSLGKNIENEARAVENAALEFAFQVALLTRRERCSENHEFGAVSFHARAQLFYLSLADEEPRLRPFSGTDEFVHDDRAGRARELRELRAFGVVRCAFGARMDEDCTFAALRSFKQMRPPATRVAFCS
jgi:hypothetical protein